MEYEIGGKIKESHINKDGVREISKFELNEVSIFGKPIVEKELIMMNEPILAPLTLDEMKTKWRPKDWNNPHHDETGRIPDEHNKKFRSYEEGATAMLNAVMRDLAEQIVEDIP